MSVDTLTPEDLERILSYLELPLASTLPAPPLEFLTTHLVNLPPPLLEPFGHIISARTRASIPEIKHRRVLYATQSPLPPELRADRGRLRWPLLWERMGGMALPPPSANVTEEEKWVEESFLPGKENSQHVKKLGGFLRVLEEEREMEGVRAAKREERKLDNVGEEFDDESDEEDEDEDEGSRPRPMIHPDMVNASEQEEVARAFEKRIIEMFVDGVDTVEYDHVDFNEPEGGDPIAVQDRLDAYFDEEEPSRTPNGHDQGSGLSREEREEADRILQNGQGEYDY